MIPRSIYLGSMEVKNHDQMISRRKEAFHLNARIDVAGNTDRASTVFVR